MNADRAIFGRTGRTGRTGRALLLCAAAASLAGCMTAPMYEPYGEEVVDPASPAAARIAAQAAEPRDFPTFGDIPQLPTDLRTPEGWRSAVAATEEDRAGLLAAVAPSTWSLSGTEAFAQRTRAALGFDPADIPTTDHTAEAEAWAARMRERATPPPRPR